MVINILRFCILFSTIFILSFTNGNKEDLVIKHSSNAAFPEPCFTENNTFIGGEEITYKVYYNWNFIWLAAGEVVMKVEEDDDQYHLSAVGRTFKSYEWFFKIRDYYDTYVDIETLLPKVSIRDINEGKYTMYDKVTFDQKSKKAVSERGRYRDKLKSTEYDIGECMHDILSILYYTRNIDFRSYEEGEVFPVKIFMDKEVWPLGVKYNGAVPGKKIRNRGKFNTLHFNPEVILGDIFTEKNKMQVWVSDDQNRIPLLIESPVSVGSVKVVMKKYSGLKYDLDSKLD